MSKRIVCLLLALCLVLGCGISAMAAGSDFDIYVNGVLVEDAEGEVEDGTTYAAAFFLVRAMYPDAAVSWEFGQTVIRAEGLTISAKAGDYYIVANGRYLFVPDRVQVHPETQDLMVPVRVLAKAMGAEVSYDANGVYLIDGTGPILSGEQFYDPEVVDLIARVIWHEAGNQSFYGKMAVGNVILHRVCDKRFPNTVSGVIYQKNQFTGAANCKATAATIIAAKVCLDGGDVVPGACWFNTVGHNCWASRNKTLTTTIGNHSFYQ